MDFSRTAAAAAALAITLVVAAGCGSGSGDKPPIHLEGNSIVADGRTIQFRVWDSGINCFRPLSSFPEAELTKPEKSANATADLYLDLTVDRDCDVNFSR